MEFPRCHLGKYVFSLTGFYLKELFFQPAGDQLE